MWLYRTGQYTANPVVLYDYQTTRSSANPIKFLTGFKGHLHADGYSGYKTLAQNSGGNIKLCGCWAHARRKFNEAIQSAPPEVQENCTSRKGLEYCDKLFALERRYEQLQLPPEARRAKRLEQSKQVTDEFFSWAKETYALPRSALGKAINYALEQRPYLETFYTDGRLEISNNRAERSIKPFVIGRKNWLFCNTAKGARASQRSQGKLHHLLCHRDCQRKRPQPIRIPEIPLHRHAQHAQRTVQRTAAVEQVAAGQLPQESRSRRRSQRAASPRTAPGLTAIPGR